MGDMGDPPKKKCLISLCVGCNNQIHDQYILRVSPDFKWHAACLKCAECNQYLDKTCTCFVRDGKTNCKRDYIRYATYIPAACAPPAATAHRARESCPPAPPRPPLRSRGSQDRQSERDEPLQGAGLRPSTEPSASAACGKAVLSTAEPISARQPALRPHVHKQPEKTTRVRTVLNEKQLHTLRTCYAANPRPDALMKEQLVEMTGLSPRVIRVWFQNKRCKDKKRSIMMKQLQQIQHSKLSNIQGMTGTPMVAASPERHDGGLQANPVEVQSYQPPWKVLSDFALQSDIDQPAFQQLVNFSEGGPGSNSTGSEVASMSSQLPDTPNSMVASPIEA
ncbi:PREDICTED: insulin gene enhancer protein ISL-1 [Charadrius vociferus]|uniref:insulin gene enhancer protein ISL-1 n=1 Tax=Charadrius vociferus TaxID=50402 RepID=UPI000521C759|nr:PREDICTED: insulin gene enhancer protein ISL-1 [Charadrius vociferus]